MIKMSFNKIHYLVLEFYFKYFLISMEHFYLCFLVSLSFHFHLYCLTWCAASIPQKQHLIPISCFSIFVTSSLSSFVHAHEYGRCWSKVFCFFFLLLFGLVVLLKGLFSAAQILASWTSSASLVFHSLLMRMLSFQLKVLDLAFWFVQPHGFQCWGFSPICLRFGVTWILPY